jgi:hypothetical protein
MKIIHPNNYYLEDVKATFSDAEEFYQCFLSWPTGSIPLNACLSLVSKSAGIWSDVRAKKEVIKSFDNAYMFLKNPSGDVIGITHFEYVQDFDEPEKTFFNSKRSVVKPQYRGQGHFTTLFDLLVYFGHFWLKAENSIVITLDTAPEVDNKLNQIDSGETIGEVTAKRGKNSWVEKENKMNYDDFHPRALGRDAGFKFIVRGVEKPPPYSFRNPRPGSPT